jgi:hypothetical protein
LVDEVCEWFEQIRGDDDTEEREIWEGVSSLLKFDGASLDEGTRQRLEAVAVRIFGDSLADGIKRYAGRFAAADWPSDDESVEKPEAIARRLADEALGRLDEVKPTLLWLFSTEAEQVWPFAYRLGELDVERTWFPALLEAATGGSDPRMLSGYLQGRAANTDGEWCDNLLDAWANDPALVRFAIDATARGTPSDRAIKRILVLLDREFVTPSSLHWLTWGHWTSGVSLDAFVELLSRIVADDSPEAARVAIELAHYALGSLAPSIELRDLAWCALESPQAQQRDQMLAYYWRQLATTLVADDPARVARAIVNFLLIGEAPLSDERLKLLRDALASYPDQVWPEIAKGLLAPQQSFFLTLAFRWQDLLADVDERPLIRWVEEHGTEAAKAVASAIDLKTSEVTELVRFLLRNFPHDVKGILAGSFMTGMWQGSEEAHLRSQIEQVRRWREDSEPAVRRWSQELEGWLRERLTFAKQREAEDELR